MSYYNYECNDYYIVHMGGWNWVTRYCLKGHVLQLKDNGFHCCLVCAILDKILFSGERGPRNLAKKSPGIPGERQICKKGQFRARSHAQYLKSNIGSPILRL